MAESDARHRRLQALLGMLARRAVMGPLADDAHGQAHSPTLRPSGNAAAGILGRQGNRGASSFAAVVSADGQRIV